MPDWSLSLAVVVLGLLGVLSGSLISGAALGAMRTVLPRPVLIGFMLLPTLAVIWLAVSAGAVALGLGVSFGVAVLGGLLLIRARIQWNRAQLLHTESLMQATVSIWNLAQIIVGLTLLLMGARVLVMGTLDLALVLELHPFTLGLVLLAPLCLVSGWMLGRHTRC